MSPDEQGRTTGNASSSRPLGGLARNTANMASVNYIVTAVNLFTGVFTARVLGPGGKGVYYAVMSWTGVAGSLALLGLPASMAWFFSRAPSPRDVYRLFVLLALGSSVLTIIVFLWPLVASLRHVAPWAPSFAVIGLLLVPLGGVSALAQMVLQVSGRFVAYNWLRFWRTFTFAACVVGLAVLNHLTAGTLIVIAYATNGIPSALYVWWASKALKEERTWQKSGSDRLDKGPSLGQALGMAMAYFIPALASTFNTRLDQMLNTIWLSSASIGRYGVALSALGVGFGVLGAFQVVFFASRVGGNREEILSQVARAARALTIVSIALVILIVAVGRIVLLELYGASYTGTYVILISLIFSVPFMTVIGVVYQAFGTLGKPLMSFASEATGAVTGAVLLWLLTPRFGAVGAGAADTLSYACDLAVVLWQWTRLGGKVPELLPRKADVAQVGNALLQYTRHVVAALTPGRP